MKYPIEHYKKILKDFPTTLVQQEHDLLEHIAVLEIRIQVLEEELRRTKIIAWEKEGVKLPKEIVRETETKLDKWLEGKIK